MSFLNRLLNKPVVLHLYTTRPELMRYSRPDRMSKFYPAWWKALPKDTGDKYMNHAPTMKGCVGFIDMFQSGLAIPMWTDTAIEVGPIGSTHARWRHSDRISAAEVHPPEQRGTWLPETHYQHVKLECPWVAVCTDDIKWIALQPVWNAEKPETLLTPPGILDFKHQHSLNVNTLIPRTDKSEIHHIDQGRPMLQLVPITERKVEYEYHVVSEAELRALRQPRLWFLNVYRHQKAMSCPYKPS